MKRGLCAPLMILLFIFCCSFASVSQTKSSKIRKDSLAEINKVWPRVHADIGAFYANYNTGIAVGSEQLGIGLNLDIEQALGLDVNRWSFRGDAQFRLGKTRKNSLFVGYFGVNRIASKKLKVDLEIGEHTFPLGTTITSRYDITILRLKYDYAFYQDPRVSIGVSIGAFVMPVRFAVVADTIEGQSTNFTAPFPVVGIRSDFRISNKLSLRQSAELLFLPLENFSGSVLDLTFCVDYFPFKNFGIGIGVNSYHFEFTARDTSYPLFDFFGTLTFGYTGALAFLSFKL